jgi:hypothetical protein
MSAPARRIFTVEATLPQSGDAAALEWLQKFLDYFHPGLNAVVKTVERVEGGADDMLG